MKIETPIAKNMTYNWNDTSTYIKHPPFFDDLGLKALSNIDNARILALLATGNDRLHFTCGTIRR